jgi:hypothetical protein
VNALFFFACERSECQHGRNGGQVITLLSKSRADMIVLRREVTLSTFADSGMSKDFALPHRVERALFKSCLHPFHSMLSYLFTFNTVSYSCFSLLFQSAT